jgi:EAL domain-containing protein (putative c-di-GMP-specific phosphodiesterase class I)
MREACVTPDGVSILDNVLRRNLVRSVFQPIVDLETRAVVGFEALARGPEGSGFERPERLFAVAASEGRAVELDRACQRAAVEGALTNGFTDPLTTFVNIERDTVGFGPLPRLEPGLRCVLELTERTLTSRPAELLPAIQRARAEGWGIALDDVGADARSLALMPLVRPDVIKLDLRLIQAHPTPEIAAIVGAVGSEAERTGATVVAEGIETDEQAQYARALGATLGQGWLFGGPTTRPPLHDVTPTALPILDAALPHPLRTPFELAIARHESRRGTEPLLAAISRELGLQAAHSSGTPLLITTLPAAEHFRTHMRDTYERLASEVAFAVTIAVDMPTEPAPGVRGIQITEDDPLHGTWNVVVIGTHFASMLAARPRAPSISGEAPSFDFVYTFERPLIIECAQALTLRIALAVEHQTRQG